MTEGEMNVGDGIKSAVNHAEATSEVLDGQAKEFCKFIGKALQVMSVCLTAYAAVSRLSIFLKGAVRN